MLHKEVKKEPSPAESPVSPVEGETLWTSCRSKRVPEVIIPQEHEWPCIELWDFPVILTFDHDPLSPPPETCLLVNLVVMRVTHQHFRGSPQTQSSAEG